MTRVLVMSGEPVGGAMAGPAIRALELARVLAAHCQVTLAAPGPSRIDDPRVDLFLPEQDGMDAHDLLARNMSPPTTAPETVPTTSPGTGLTTPPGTVPGAIPPFGPPSGPGRSPGPRCGT